MNSFYYGNDQGQDYWINLNHVCFVKPEKDKLILKMSDGNVVGIDGEDYDALKAVLIAETVNWEPEYDDKRYNHEDVPSREEVEASKKISEYEEEWGRPLGSFSDNDYLDDDEIPI
jgi:hypothetical protein